MKLRTLFVLLAAFVVAAPVFAHHGRGATFDMKNRVTLKGTVSQFKWQNPLLESGQSRIRIRKKTNGER